MVSFNPPKPRYVEELIVTWNGTLDRLGTCPRLTGGIQRKAESGEKPRERAERKPYERSAHVYAQAKAEIR